MTESDGSSLAGWVEVARRVVYRRFGRGIEEVDFRLPSGRVETYSVRTDTNSVAVVALTLTGEIILTRQFRPGPQRFLYELPGGYVDASEEPAVAAARELEEETGYAGSVEIVGSCYADSYSTSVKYCGVALDCVPSATRESGADELIEVLRVTPDELRKLMTDGDLADIDLAYLGMAALRLL